MKKRTVKQWAQRQYRGDVEPWPRWVRFTLIGLAVAIIAGKILGWF